MNIIETNLLTKFHEDRKINVASRVLTSKNAPPMPRPRGGHVFQPTGIIFELVQDIIGMNLLTKFHEDRTIKVASRVKNVPPLGGHVFQANVTIFELIQDIIKTNLLTIFHQDWTINVASRVLTNIIFELVQDINGMNLLTKFHKDWTINVASREKCPAPWQPCFSSKDPKINVTSTVLTRKNALPPGGHVFQPTGIIFELVQNIIGINLLTKFYEDQTINVDSRVKNAPPLGSHVFQANVTIFELIQDIIETNLLTNFMNI
ncbi:hypothetical protein DPMN_121504 [Dreissena polymorpha]|uniref:Uncharacterized protein n=1 Tax=Dreissena polymorpha TaxID=45954 RepID=A0A9D4GMK5_DREPO|nr:hypothetical protein DPMN_121504 [Dreissena polymorpha]